MKKKKMISLRIKEGWVRVENQQKFNCDVCGKRLWIAPHGGLYCDEVHSKEIIGKEVFK